MVRFKIRDKKPKDSIKHKTPKKDKKVEIIQKKPSKTIESFDLPPFRQNKNNNIPKTDYKPPSSHGMRKLDDITTSKSNVLPPVSEQSKKQDYIESIPPSSKGSIPEKIRKKKLLNKKIQINKSKNAIIQKFPSTTGTERSKSFVNKPISKSVTKKLIKDIPPAFIKNGAIKKKDKIKNQRPPLRIIEKKPIKPKIQPPPTFEDKIPKTQIRKKKPK